MSREHRPSWREVAAKEREECARVVDRLRHELKLNADERGVAGEQNVVEALELLARAASRIRSRRGSK